MKFKEGDKAMVTKDRNGYRAGEIVTISHVSVLYGQGTLVTEGGDYIHESDLMSLELKPYDDNFYAKEIELEQELATIISIKCDCGAHAVGSEMHDDFCSLYRGLK